MGVSIQRDPPFEVAASASSLRSCYKLSLIYLELYGASTPADNRAPTVELEAKRKRVVCISQGFSVARQLRHQRYRTDPNKSTIYG